jgi:Flp pilus assembly protein TadD
VRGAVAGLLVVASACGPALAPDSALDDARMLAESGRLDAAHEALVALDEAHPGDGSVALVAGEVATWRGFADDGLAWMRRAAERRPDDPEPHLRAAYILLVHPPEGERDVDAALREAAAALADAGGVESADYRACRGEAALVEGDEGAAEAWFRGALQLRPDCRWALQRLLQVVAGRGAATEGERDALNERLSALITASRSGSGMENARMPVSFCGH